MQPKDPRIEFIRSEFLSNLSRLCLLLAACHFLALIPLIRMESNYSVYPVAILGFLLGLLGFFAQKIKIGDLQNKIKQQLSDTLLQDRLNTIGLLASGLAHELNTPLTSLEFLLDSEKENIPPKVHSHLLQDVRRMGKITREFLHFANPHTKPETFDLNELIQETLPFLSRFYPHHVRVETKFHSNPVYLHGYKNQIEQIILNIFRNALDALEKNPHPTFHLETTIEGDGNPTFILSDNGSGIPKQALSHIFDPFFTTKVPGKGTGLGLFVVQKIVAQHQANILVESNNTGTLFKIVFPRRERKAA